MALFCLILSACGTRTQVELLGTVPAGEPIAADSILVFEEPSSVLVRYEPVATITGELSWVTNYVYFEDDLRLDLRGAAAEARADALIVEEVIEHRTRTVRGCENFQVCPPTYLYRVPERMRATAARLHFDSSEVGLSPVKALGEGQVLAVAPVPIRDALRLGADLHPERD